MPSYHFLLVVANVACSYCLLQIISTCIGPYRLAQQTQVLQEGHFTPYDHVFTLCQQMHTEPVEMLTIWLVSPRNRPRNRPRDVWFRFRFFSVSSKKPTETDRLFGEKPKNRPSHFLLSVHNPVSVILLKDSSYPSRNYCTDEDPNTQIMHLGVHLSVSVASMSSPLACYGAVQRSRE